MKKIIFFISVLLIFDTCMVIAENEKFLPMTAIFENKTASSGDVVALKLSFSLDSTAKLPEDINLQGIDELIIIDIEKASGSIILHLLVDTLDLFEVPSLKLAFSDQEENERFFKSEAVSLKLLPVFEDETDKFLRPIKDILPVGYHWKIYLLCIGGAVLLIAIVLLWIFIKKHRTRKFEPVYVDPPEVTACNALRELKESAGHNIEEIKTYYFSLSRILKEYMEKTKSFPAAELTTEEIFSFVQNDIDRDIVGSLKIFDMIKFADMRPTTAEREEHWNKIFVYVKKTSENLSKIHT
ncbi:conserved hypothetical protein [Candidatus Magnetomoraceae bacterium gMMP-1]